MSFDGLRVAITGGARDTGRMLAEAFADRGARIYLSARDLTAASETAAAIGRAEAFQCDLAVPDSVRAFAAAVAARTGHLDVLINNGAAYLEGNDLGDVADDDIDNLMTVGGTGPLLVTKHLLPLLRASPR